MHVDLNKAWRSKSGYFIGLITLLCVSCLFYLLSSLVDPGFLPKLDVSEMAALEKIQVSESKVQFLFFDLFK